MWNIPLSGAAARGYMLSVKKNRGERDPLWQRLARYGSAAMSVVLFLGFLAPVMSQGAEIRPVKGKDPAITVEGEITPGDSLKIKNLIKKLDPSGKGGEVIFDSPGGNFMEGIYLGIEIFENGWATRVKAEGICLSACATAFLGGRYRIPDSGWLPDRNLEAGATLGFHSFYVDNNMQGPVARSLNAGKNIANIFFAYANMLGIRSDVLVKMLDIDPDNVLIANNPELLSDLSINVTRLPPWVARALTSKGAINASICLIARNQPLLLNEEENNWRLKPAATVITTRDFKHDILQRLLHHMSGEKRGDIAAIFAAGMSDANKLDRVYDEIVQLGLAPGVEVGEKIIKVSGLTHKNPFMNKIAYFMAKNEGKADFGVDYLLCPAEDGICESGSLKKYGEIIYELQPRDLPLWDIK